MKRFYTIVLALALVLGLGTIASAVSTSYTATVEVTYTFNGPSAGFAAGGDTTAYMDVDWTTNFSDTVSAGIVGEIDFWGANANITGPGVGINGHGWITVKEMFGFLTMTAQTDDVNPAAGNICGSYATPTTGAGVVLEAPLDPMTLGASFNDDCFGVSAAFASDLFSFNFAYAGTDDGLDSGFAVWGTVGSDALSVDAEYDYADGPSAYFIEGNFNLADAGLSGMIGYEGNTPGWDYGASLPAANIFDMADLHFAQHNYSDPVYDHFQTLILGGGGNIYGTIDYVAVPDLLTVTVNGQYCPDPGLTNMWEVDGNLGFDLGGGLTADLGGGYCADSGYGQIYKVYADTTYQVTDALSLSGNVGYYYLGGMTGTKVGAGLDYTFAEGVVGSASFDYDTVNGYSASLDIEATL